MEDVVQTFRLLLLAVAIKLIKVIFALEYYHRKLETKNRVGQQPRRKEIKDMDRQLKSMVTGN